MRTSLGLCLMAYACRMGYGQAPNTEPGFDAVSVKVAPPPDGRGGRVAFIGGPGTKTPNRINVENYGMAALISRAYGVEYYQVTGPDWITSYNSPKYNIVATIPPGTTEAQFRLMLQKLLADRFQLKLHKQQREMQIYSLVVAKNGPKLKKAAPEPPPDPDSDADAGPRAGGGKLAKDAEGYPVLRPGMTMAMSGDRARAGNKEHMAWLVAMLAAQLGSPVVDATGLTEEYEFSLYWIPSRPGSGPSLAEDPAGPDIFAAVQQQLGLKLEQKKGPIEVLVVDSAEKTPAEN